MSIPVADEEIISRGGIEAVNTSETYDASALGSQQILPCMRSLTVLLLIDRLGLYGPLCAGVKESESGDTCHKVIAAGQVLGLLENDAGCVRLIRAYRELGHEAWHQLIAVMGHQVTYLRLALCDPGSPEPPARQLAADPDAYHAFLRGVAASHERHAQWLAAQARLEPCRVLVDLGGGWGTFSRSWVSSRPDREAILLDLPGVYDGMHSDFQSMSGIRLGEIDLAGSFTVPASGDIYLLANVLHLFPDWRRIIADTLSQMPPAAKLAVLEAEGESASGKLFDLQVHLRSGRSGGLLPTADVAALFNELDCRLQGITVPPDHNDPFQRSYRLWLAVQAAGDP